MIAAAALAEHQTAPAPMPEFLEEFETGEAKVVTMEPVGPVADRFRNDKTFIATIMGPYGSAKTTTCFQKILNSVLWQRPGPDGVRRVRWCVIRDTYDQLQTNVMEDWFAWFPKTDKNFNGEKMKHTLTIDMPNFGTLVIEMLFRALGNDAKPEKVFKGMQLTGLWLNEADTLNLQVLKFGLPRVGRYPGTKDGGCAWSGIIADMNAPDVDNWTYDLLVNKQLDIGDELLERLQALYGPLFGIAFHRQPGGLDPQAENLKNLTPGYYERMMIGLTENEVRRFVHNEFGAVNNGQPVYPEFIDRFHVSADELQPLPGIPIHCGLDGGSTPAMVFGQLTPEGQLRILSELVVFQPDATKQLAKLGPTSFARAARDYIADKWPRAKIGQIWGDPAAFYGGDEEDLSWALLFSKEFKQKVRPAPVRGNRISPRLEAVRGRLTGNVGNKPGILLSPSCKVLRRGFNNGYVIQRIKLSSGAGRWKDEPDKTNESHVHDALQYLAVGVAKKGEVLDDLDARQASRKGRGRVDYGDDYFAGRA